MAWRRQAGRKRAPDAGVLDLRLRPQDRTGGPPARAATAAGGVVTAPRRAKPVSGAAAAAAKAVPALAG